MRRTMIRARRRAARLALRVALWLDPHLLAPHGAAGAGSRSIQVPPVPPVPGL